MQNTTRSFKETLATLATELLLNLNPIKPAPIIPSREKAAPQRIEKLASAIGKRKNGHYLAATSLQADAQVALELVFFGQRIQRFQIG
jgi:hypothetical protein